MPIKEPEPVMEVPLIVNVQPLKEQIKIPDVVSAMFASLNKSNIPSLTNNS